MEHENKILLEQLANLAHEQWSGWLMHLFSKGKFNKDGTWTMPSWAVSRWTKQMNTKYCDLTQEEQDSDRAEAGKFLLIVEPKA